MNLKSYDEEQAIKEIEKYLSSCKYKNNGFKEISSKLYDKFIDNDDEHLIKLIKRLLIIYKRFHTKLLQRMFHKWQIITLKLNFGIYDYKYNFNLDEYENELDEPQMQKKPKLYFNVIKNNFKNNRNKNKLSANKSFKNKSANIHDDKKNTKFAKYENPKNEDDLSNIKRTDIISPSSNPKKSKNKGVLKKSYKNENLDFEDVLIKSLDVNNKLNKTLNDYREEKENIKNKTFLYDNSQDNNYFTRQEKENDNSLDNLIMDSQKQKLENYFYNDDKNSINNNIYHNANDIDISSHFDYNFNSELNKSKSVDKKTRINDFISLKTKPWVYSYYRRGSNNTDNDIFLKIKKKRPLMNNLERQELFNNLYNDSKKRKEKYKKLSMEKEARFNTIYTFTPKIIHNKLNEKYLKNMAESKFNNNANTPSFYNYNNYSMNNSSLVTNNNNFNNNIRLNKNNNNELGIVIEENKGEFTLDFMSRLAEYDKIKKNNLEKIKNEVEINLKGNNINKNRSKYDFIKRPNNSLLNNSENYFEIRKKNIEKIEQNMNEEQGITFQPKTNKSFNNKIKNNIIERNKEFIKEKQEKLEKFSNIKEKECTFKPKINESATMAILNNIKEGQQISINRQNINNEDVSKRLFDYQNKYKEKLETIRSKYKKSYPFKPEISKNTDSILNNKQKIMEQIKDNENNIINNIQDYRYNNEFNNNNFDNDIDNNINHELLIKQKKLGNLEEISKRISELSEENMIYTEEKISAKKKGKEISNESKIINENNQIVYNDYNNSIESNNFQINPTFKNKNLTKIKNNISFKDSTTKENSDKILELAQNLLNEDLIRKQNQLNSNDTSKYYNNSKNKDNTKDFGFLMLYNNSLNNKYNKENQIIKKNNYAQEYDFDNSRGNKRIMDLNYYDNLLQ